MRRILNILFLLLFMGLVFFNCAGKLHFNYNAFTSESFSPTDEIVVYSFGRNPDVPYVKIGEVVVRGGDYSFRLKKTIEMAKSSGAEAIIVRGDKININFKSSSMVSFAIRYTNTSSEDDNNDDSDSEFEDIEYIDEEYFDE